VRTAVEQGALVANYTEATGFVQEHGRIAGVEARDTLTGETYTIAARHVVNAAGVWAEQVESLGTRQPQVQVLPAKGIHLVVDAAKVGVTRDAVVLPETEDGRLIFIVPWQGRAVIGTTDTPGGDIERPRADADEIAYVLRTTNRSIRAPLTEADIISTYAGYRPLVRARDGAKSAALARTHAVLSSPNGLVTIVGGKLTTYRRMAQDTVDTLELHGLNVRASVTDHLPLAGADGYGHWKRALPDAAARRGLDADVAAHLLQSYGSDAPLLFEMIDNDPLLAARMAPDLPVIFAEADFAARYEMAMTVEDVLARRTRLSLIDRLHGIAAAPDVAAILGDALGWDGAERARQVDDYRAKVEDLHVPVPPRPLAPA
jgi:glycerol-3-phosphate dehydrogenase